MASVIKLNTGNGFGFTEQTPQALKVDTVGSNILTEEDGLFVEDPPVEIIVNATVDDWTMNQSISLENKPIPSINRNVVNMIFSMCAYSILSRDTDGGTTITVDTSSVKSLTEMVDEMNRPLVSGGDNTISYQMRVGELFQLMSTPHGRVINVSGGGHEAVEDGNRYPDNANKTLALFCVTEIVYAQNGYYINNIRLKCLYSSLSSFVKGQTYGTF